MLSCQHHIHDRRSYTYFWATAQPILKKTSKDWLMMYAG